MAFLHEVKTLQIRVLRAAENIEATEPRQIKKLAKKIATLRAHDLEHGRSIISSIPLQHALGLYRILSEIRDKFIAMSLMRHLGNNLSSGHALTDKINSFLITTTADLVKKHVEIATPDEFKSTVKALETLSHEDINKGKKIVAEIPIKHARGLYNILEAFSNEKIAAQLMRHIGRNLRDGHPVTNYIYTYLTTRIPLHAPPIISF